MKFDKVLYNGNIITMDEELSRKKWIGINDGVITELGDDNDHSTAAAEIIDLKGATVLPGLFDCHIHVLLAGLCLNSVDLSDVSDIDEILMRMKKACDTAEEGAYVYGANLVPHLIKEKRYPTAKELDEISNGHLIIIFAATMHGCSCTTSGMKIAAVDDDLPGVGKDKDGRPTGVYESDESSFVAISNLIGSLSDDELWKFITDCVANCAANGITNLHGLFGQFVKDDRDIDLMLERGDSLPIDIAMFYQTWDVDKAKSLGLPRVGGCLTLDGTSFEYTMANYEPYVTAPELRGVLYHNDDEVYQVIKKAHENDMQCTMHVLGERAIDQLLYTYHRVIGEQGPKDLRHRIEHFCLPTDEQIKMAKDLNLILSMQPAFTQLWNDVFVELLGQERADRIDQYQKIINAGIIVCAGSDSPVTQITPLDDMAYLVRGFNPNRNTTLTEALKMFTTNAAYAVGLENRKGSIEIGKDGDLTVIDKDPYDYQDSDELFGMKVIMTMNKGNILYSGK